MRWTDFSLFAYLLQRVSQLDQREEKLVNIQELPPPSSVNRAGDLVTQEMEKAEVLSDFFSLRPQTLGGKSGGRKWKMVRPQVHGS